MNKRIVLYLLFCMLPLISYSQEPFYFIQLTDPQLGMFEENKGYKQETLLMESAIKAINNLSPAFIVITGDLVHDGENAEQLKEFKRLKSLFRKDLSVYVLPGNHDVGQEAPEERVKKYIDRYGYDCFSFQVNNTCFIGINSQIIWANKETREQEQYIWMKKVLENTQQCNHRILFAHHPVFMKDPDEADKYDNYPLSVRKKYLDLFVQYKVGYIFTGHLHYNHTNTYKNVQIQSTSALGKQLKKDSSGIRIVKVYPDKIQSEYYAIEEIPKEIKF